jgi:hypothetical protein
MPRRRSLKDLVSDVRSRVDQQTSNGATAFITDAEITEWLNKAVAWLHDDIDVAGEFWRLNQNTFTTVNSQPDYGLPDDIKKPVGVDIQVGGYWQNAHRFNFEQRNDYQNVTGDWTWPVFIYYDLWGDYLHFIPTPNGPYPVRLWYVPVTQRMQLGGDNGASSYIDGINGWEDFAIDWAAKKCAEKDENWEFVQALSGDLAETRERILKLAGTRNQMEAPRARVIRGRLWSPGVPRRWWGW